MSRKVNSHIEDPTFNQWLYHRRKDHPKLARFVDEDRGCWPDRPRTLQTLLDHVREHEDGPSEMLLRKAFSEYTRDREAKVRIPRRIAKDPLPDKDRRRIKTYSVAPTTPTRIERLRRSMGLGSGGRVIDALVEAALDR